MSIKKKKILYILDGTAYIYRAYHAVRNLITSTELPVNAILGFTRMLVKLIHEKKPEYAVICFDAKGPTFRHHRYQAYKANRPPMPEDMAVQLPYIKEIVAGFNIKSLEKSGFEADDLMGTLSCEAQKCGLDVIMVTSDKDFLQLVSADAVIWDPVKSKTTDLLAIHSQFGLKPAQIIDVMGLSGDTSDNIPGVPGIGPKTALSLIQTYGSMAQLYEHLDEIKKKKQHENLVNFREQAFLSLELVTIDTQVPLNTEFKVSDFKLPGPNADALGNLFKTLEFRQFQKDYPPPTDRSKKNYTKIEDQKVLEELSQQLVKAEFFALAVVEQSGLSFSLTPNKGFYVPWKQAKFFKPVLENPLLKKVTHNLKNALILLQQRDIKLAGVESDLMLVSYLLNPSGNHELEQIALGYLDYKIVPVEQTMEYACENADLILLAYHALMPVLEEQGLKDLLTKIELPLTAILMKMEVTGICVNAGHLQNLSASFQNQLEDLEEQVYALAGEKFNIKSSPQLGYILFEKLGLPIQKKTRKKTGYSTDVNVLTMLAAKHDLPDLILRHRTLSKLKSTYTDSLLKLINPQTNRIHTNFNQTVTATGRLSSSDPNLQNIPIRTKDGRLIRAAFVSRPEWVLISADYSQIELRILAHCSHDEILMQAFQEDEDIHQRTAMEIFQVFPSFITPDLRQQAKAINFGIIYGLSAFGLSRILGITRKMAKTYIDNYFSRYQGVKKFLDQIVAQTQKEQYITTMLGRIRKIPDINSPRAMVRQAAERIAVNTSIQGTAADLIKLAMININRAIKEQRLAAVMLLSVHDEIVLETPQIELDQTCQVIKKVMENVWDLKVPLKVNLNSGSNWMETH